MVVLYRQKKIIIKTRLRYLLFAGFIAFTVSVLRAQGVASRTGSRLRTASPSESTPSHLFKFEIPMYIIAMKNSRRFLHASLFRQVSANVVHIEGVDSKSQHSRLLVTPLSSLPPLCDNADATIIPRQHLHSPEFWGALGCSLAHLKTISQLRDNNASVALIVEDDAVPDTVPFWTSSLEEFVSSLPPDWSIVQLSLTGEQSLWKSTYRKWQKDKARISKNTQFWGTVAYLISRKGIESVVNAYGHGTFNISALSCLNADYELLKNAVAAGSFYISTPPLLTFTDEFSSQVHSETAWTDFGDTPANSRANVHFFSRHFSLEWNAINWRDWRVSSKSGK